LYFVFLSHLLCLGLYFNLDTANPLPFRFKVYDALLMPYVAPLIAGKTAEPKSE
jgi:hypothetical protein